MAQGIARPDINKAIEKGGNLEKIQMDLSLRIVELLELMYTEMKIQTDILVEGLDTGLVDPEDLRRFDKPTAGNAV